MNTASLTTRTPTPAALAVPVVATPDSMLSSMTATKSSTTRMPMISCPRVFRSWSLSRSIFTRTAELLMERAAPRKKDSLPDHPSSSPTS